MNLALLIVKRIWIQDHWHEVEIESPHLVCSKCGCYGHVTRECTLHTNSKNDHPEGTPKAKSGGVQLSTGMKQNLHPETVVDEGSLGKQQIFYSADLQNGENQGRNLNANDEGWISDKMKAKGEE